MDKNKSEEQFHAFRESLREMTHKLTHLYDTITADELEDYRFDGSDDMFRVEFDDCAAEVNIGRF